MPSSRFFPIGSHNRRLTEDYVHQDIHDGKVYRINEYYLLGAASSVSIMMTTGADVTHLTVGLNTDGPGTGGFYEDTVATGGSAITALNADRANVDASEVTLVKDPTISTVGTTLGRSVVGSIGFKSVAGGSVLSDCWLLKPSSKYTLRFIADAASCRTVMKMVFSTD